MIVGSGKRGEADIPPRRPAIAENLASAAARARDDSVGVCARGARPASVATEHGPRPSDPHCARASRSAGRPRGREGERLCGRGDGVSATALNTRISSVPSIRNHRQPQGSSSCDAALWQRCIRSAGFRSGSAWCVCGTGRRALLLALGVAAAAGALAIVLGGSLVAQTSPRAGPCGHFHLQARGCGHICQPRLRETASRARSSSAVVRSLDGLGEPVRAVEFKLSDAGARSRTRGPVDDVSRWVRLSSAVTHANAPQALRGPPSSAARARSRRLRFVKVGEGELLAAAISPPPRAPATRVGESSRNRLSCSPKASTALRLPSSTRSTGRMPGGAARAEQHPSLGDRRLRGARDPSRRCAHARSSSISHSVAELAAARRTGPPPGAGSRSRRSCSTAFACSRPSAWGRRRLERLTSFGGQRHGRCHLVTVAETSAVALLGVVVGWWERGYCTSRGDRRRARHSAVSQLRGSPLPSGSRSPGQLVPHRRPRLPGVSLGGPSPPLNAAALGALLARLHAGSPCSGPGRRHGHAPSASSRA